MGRLIVTGKRDGRSAPVSDRPRDEVQFAHTPGFAATVLWQTAGTPVLPWDGAAWRGVCGSVLPGPGGSTLFVVTLPPDAVFAAPGFDPDAAAAEAAQKLPGLAALFEPEHPGMHASDTVDYAIVLAGRPAAEFDDGKRVELAAGDILVQHGTRHAWRNPYSEPAKMAFVMLGAAVAGQEADTA